MRCIEFHSKKSGRCITPHRGKGERVKIAIDKRLNLSRWCPALAPTQRQSRHAALTVASIPFRFKAGGSSSDKMAPVVAQSHHHRSTTKLNKKNFKSRHASKGSLKELSKGTA